MKRRLTQTLQCSRSVKSPEVFCGFHVTPRPASDVVLFVEGQLPANFCRRTQHERAWRNFHPESDEGVSANSGTCAHLHVIKNDRAHSDKDFIVDLAGVHDGAVTDGDQLSYGCWISG